MSPTPTPHSGPSSGGTAPPELLAGTSATSDLSDDSNASPPFGATIKGERPASKWQDLKSWFRKVLKWLRRRKDVRDEDLRRTLVLMIPEVRIDPETGQSYETDTQRQARARFDKCWEGDDDAIFVHPSLLDDLRLPSGYYRQYEPGDSRSQWENADGTVTNVIGEVTRKMRWYGEPNVRRVNQEIFVPDSIAIRSKVFVLSPSSRLEVLVPLEVIRKNKLDKRPRRLALAGGKRRPDPDVSDEAREKKKADLEAQRQAAREEERRVRENERKARDNERRNESSRS